MKERVYLFSSDSALLRRVLRRYSGKTCLEIGAGNGGGLGVLEDGFEEVVGTDLVLPTMNDWKGRADFVLADTATSFQDNSFDLVAANPPYIPTEDVKDKATDAGPDLRVPLSFFKEALRVAKKDGVVLILLSNSANLVSFSSEAEKAGFVFGPVDSEHLFFEDLVVFEAKRRSVTSGARVPQDLPDACSDRDVGL